MRTLIIFSVVVAAAWCMPSGQGYGQAPAAPQQYAAYAAAPAPQQQAYYAAPAQQAVYQAQARPVGPIVTGTLSHTQDTYGQYAFKYESSDGQSKNEAKQDGAVAGSFSYVDPEGQRVDLQYTAGKDGFQASGDHLPQAPAVPDLPEELASAYQEAHNRLAAAYEEARLRGDADLYTDDGSFKAEHQYKDEQHTAYAPQSAPASSYYNAAPAASYKPAPVSFNAGYKTYQAAYPAAAYPAKTANYAVAAPAPAYSAPAAAPAPAYSAPAASYSAPAPASVPAYSSSSYTTNIGGTPVALAQKAPAKSGYASFSGGY